MTHGQWIYRNIQVHDKQQGTLCTREKEIMQQQIWDKLELGFNGFLPMDKGLAEVSLDDLESSNGVQQKYWLLAVKTAREAARLSRTLLPVDTQPD